MNNKELAEKIFKLVGGKQNIHSMNLSKYIACYVQSSGEFFWFCLIKK